MTPRDKTEPVDVAAMRALCDAATPGPWLSEGVDGLQCPGVVLATRGETVAECYGAPGDEAFIATARTAVPAMLDEIERLRAELNGVPQPDANTPYGYEKPEHGWTCYHCGLTFHTRGGAALHFGAKPENNEELREQLAAERRLGKQSECMNPKPTRKLTDEERDQEASRKKLHSAHPRCESCDVRLNRYTVHKPWCRA